MVKGSAVGSNGLVRQSEIRGFPPYALIPERNRDPRLLGTGYDFEIVLQFSQATGPDQQEQVLEALRWWTNFGGVGSRTRRGLGAIKAASNDTALTTVSSDEVGRRGGWLAVGSQAVDDPCTAWRLAVDRLNTFRQGVGVGRRAGARGKPGQSNWPGAANIRSFAKNEGTSQLPKDRLGAYYPRAALGLPIMFHFKQERTPDHALEPSEGERMASPLILRPYRRDQQYLPAALLVPGWRDRVSVAVALRETSGDKSGDLGPAWPRREDERSDLAKRMDPFKSGGTDALSAFMKYFSAPVRR